MLGFAIALLILNIILMLFLYFKLNKKFSNANVIREIRQDAQKLVADIAFQTDKSITVIENKIRDANYVASELEKRIVLARTEEDKKRREADVFNSLAEKSQNTKSDVAPVNLESVNKNQLSGVSNEHKKNEEIPPQAQADLFSDNKPETKTSLEKNGESVKIYTKQILLNSKNKVIMPKESFHEQIVEMARKGFSSELIAEKVPLPLGEIELIISMNA